MIKKISILLLILLLLNSCLVMKIDKDSQPLVDFGTPLIGHFRNADYAKAVLYTVSFALSFIGMILFSPTQTNPQTGEGQSVFPISREISDPLFYTFIGTASSSFIGSSIDSAVTYHLANDKIIQLNQIQWDKNLKKTKFEVINEYREKNNKQKEDQRNELYKEEIKYYRKKLIDGTVTKDELYFIETTPLLKKTLEKELGYYYINKEIKSDKVMDDRNK